MQLSAVTGEHLQRLYVAKHGCETEQRPTVGIDDARFGFVGQQQLEKFVTRVENRVVQDHVPITVNVIDIGIVVDHERAGFVVVRFVGKAQGEGTTSGLSVDVGAGSDEGLGCYIVVEPGTI